MIVSYEECLACCRSLRTKRADALYCSHPCRQKAYRKGLGAATRRRRVELPGLGVAIESSRQRWMRTELYAAGFAVGFYPKDLVVLMPTGGSPNRWPDPYHAKKAHSDQCVFERPASAKALVSAPR